MKGFSGRTKTFIVTLCFVLVALLILVGFLVFTIFNSAAKEKNILKEISALESKQRGAQSVKAILRDTQQERAELSSRVVSDTSIITFLELVEKLERDSGTDMELVSFKPDETNKSLILNYDISGPFSNVYHLVAMLETLPYKASIKNIDIRQTEGLIEQGRQSSVNLWKGVILFSVEGYVQSDKEKK